MSFPNLIFTDEGKALQLKAMNGESITFTKVEIGNGEKPENIRQLKQLNNGLYVCGITSFETSNGYATIHWSLDSMAVTSEFNWTEYGIYAKDSFGNEVLYAYAYDSAAQLIPSSQDSSITQIEADINICIGDAENVNAVIGEYSAYADKKVVEAHINNQNNPHHVTAEDVGLGNVENVSIDDTTPTFKEADTLENISPGEKTSTLWGKTKKVISSFINHLGAVNPHQITSDTIGAAKTQHNHSTTDINSGILSEQRGGTGTFSIEQLLAYQGLTNMQLSGFSKKSTCIEFDFKNGLKIIFGEVRVQAAANSIGKTSIEWKTNYFSQKPFVFTTIDTDTISRHCSVTDVYRNRFTLVLQNKTNSPSENSVYYLAIG